MDVVKLIKWACAVFAAVSGLVVFSCCFFTYLSLEMTLISSFTYMTAFIAYLYFDDLDKEGNKIS